MPNPNPMSPTLLSRYLGQKFPPTEQQAAVNLRAVAPHQVAGHADVQWHQHRQ